MGIDDLCLDVGNGRTNGTDLYLMGQVDGDNRRGFRKAISLEDRTAELDVYKRQYQQQPKSGQ